MPVQRCVASPEMAMDQINKKGRPNRSPLDQPLRLTDGGTMVVVREPLRDQAETVDLIPCTPARGTTDRQDTNMKKQSCHVLHHIRLISNPYKLARSATDFRFHSTEQQDYYETVVMGLKNPVVEMKSIDWDHVRQNNCFTGLEQACRDR